jgi:hypothetical protein
MEYLRYVWIVYEVTNNSEYLYGVFSTEDKAMIAMKDLDDDINIKHCRMERLRLDP